MAENNDQTVYKAVAEYGNRLFHFIRNRVPTTADAEDILQDVWFQFSRVVDTQPIEQVSAWLFRVARNRITDNYRKNKPVNFSTMLTDGQEQSAFLPDLLDENGPEDEFVRNAFWEELFVALDELPEEQRMAFIWNELEGETFQSISDRTGESIKTWISRKRYAVQYLRRRLQVLYEEFFET